MLETQFCNYPFNLIGTDEAGRGPLAGPVVACAVSVEINNLKTITKLYADLLKLGVGDSKKISGVKRKEILSRLGVSPAHLNFLQKINYEGHRLNIFIEKIDASEIDKINILNASLTAMAKACEANILKMKKYTHLILIDGPHLISRVDNYKYFKNYQEHALIKGDQRSLIIGLASLCAKEARDLLMIKFDRKHPQYGFKNHFGYPTVQHKEAIKKFGVLSFHRKTFKGVSEWL